MNFISLIDSKTQNIITIDSNSMLLRLETEGNTRETRLKPYMAELLYTLFSKHPIPISYEEITELLKRHNLIISDLTRMHRKLSEIRNFLTKFSPHCSNLILNIRGVGYSLPLYFKNLHQLENKDNIQFKNVELNKGLDALRLLINESIKLTEQNKVIQHSLGYVIDCTLIKTALGEQIAIFNACEKIILKEIRIHEADFIALRIGYILAKIKTYIGLARVSEYPISELQWLDWFKQEVWLVFDELQRVLRFTNN